VSEPLVLGFTLLVLLPDVLGFVLETVPLVDVLGFIVVVVDVLPLEVEGLIVVVELPALGFEVVVVDELGLLTDVLDEVLLDVEVEVVLAKTICVDSIITIAVANAILFNIFISSPLIYFYTLLYNLF
jgi:hypothetical protein